MKKRRVFLLLSLMFFSLLGVSETPSDPSAVNGSGEVVTYDRSNKRDKTVIRKGGNARKAWLQIPEKEYDPNTLVYCDALWMRVHAADSPALILKDKKQTMTLEQADREGWRIGESGQSGRERTSFHGYRRKYPEAQITKDTLAAGSDNPRHVRHLPGSHRYWPGPDHERKSIYEWEKEGFRFSPHCIERGPRVATISDENWEKVKMGVGRGESFVPPEGWEPMPFSPDALPPKSEIDLLIQETLSGSYGIQEILFDNPVASVEHFMTMRFFFPVREWLEYYKAYRGTGDKRMLEKLRGSARHYHQVSSEYLEAGQLKAKDPEGMAYMYSMAASARITMQLARKYPDQVSEEEIAEAEAFLSTMVEVLKPHLEDDRNLDPEMGIPQPLADDFRSRAYNRAMNGIGTLSMAIAAMKDAQSVRGHRSFQSSIDRYTKAVKAYVDHFQEIGHLSQAVPGKPMFVYPYNGTHTRVVEGAKIYGRYEDAGHYSHTLQGLMLIHDATPELGVDDAFMTAVANAIQFNYTTRIQKGNRQEFSAHIQCPVSKRVAPQGGERGKNHVFRRGPGTARFYMLEAFQPGVIEALNTTANEAQKVEAAKEHRVEILHVHYLKALREDPSLIHLGEVL